MVGTLGTSPSASKPDHDNEGANRQSPNTSLRSDLTSAGAILPGPVTSRSAKAECGKLLASERTFSGGHAGPLPRVDGDRRAQRPRQALEA